MGLFSPLLTTPPSPPPSHPPFKYFPRSPSLYTQLYTSSPLFPLLPVLPLQLPLRYSIVLSIKCSPFLCHFFLFPLLPFSSPTSPAAPLPFSHFSPFLLPLLPFPCPTSPLPPKLNLDPSS